jgi:GTP-binding protein HflX
MDTGIGFNEKYETINRVPEKAVLVGLSSDVLGPGESATEVSMAELEALLETAGGVSCGVVMQNRAAPDPRSFIGAGKVTEVKELLNAQGAEMVVFDNDLSPSQMRVLSEELGVKVLDRSGLILDIFAGRAKTREGRLQVELAQYKYLLPRLVGMWTHLVRQTASGGSRIGTRGPGETQLESDRRHIHRKIDALEAELEEVRRVRGTQRRLREKNSVFTVALVGYTNAGKSTLLNALTDSDIQTGDRLFDTLDTTTRRLRLDETLEVLLSDTVGFISKLPHQLVEAFKATLEELSYADLLLHVIDASNPNYREQAEVVNALITELGAEKTPRIEVYNKCDKAGADELFTDSDAVKVSAITGEGLDELKARIFGVLSAGTKTLELLIPYDKGGVLDLIHKNCRILETNYVEDGISLKIVCPARIYSSVKDFVK